MHARLTLPVLLLAAAAHAQPATTVITHGFSLGDKGAWVQGMADEILIRAGAGRIYRYPCGAHQHRWNPVPNPPGVPDDDSVIVLIFNWTDDAGLGVDGENWGFAQAAADALTAAIRDADYVATPGPADLAADRALHLIGHSRGAVVNAEAARRLAIAGIDVDQTTTLDPHPVNGTLDDCNPFANLDWGDSVPAKWSTTDFADNYWRTDNNICDFDGMPLDLFSQAHLDNDVLTNGGYSIEHSDTHLWYHATIDTTGDACDGEACLDAALRDLWFTPPEPNPLYDDQFGGYYYSHLGGGSAERPDQPDGLDPGTLPVVVNGGFDHGAVSGWRYHAGDVSPSDLASDAGNDYLRLTPANPDATHNRLYLPAGATTVAFRVRTITAGADDTLVVDLVDDDGAVSTSPGLPVDTPTGAFADATLDLPPVPTDAAYRLRPRIDPGPDRLVQATVGLDDVDVLVAFCAADFNADGSLDILDFVAFQTAFVTHDPSADCDANGAFNILDFVCFQQLFQAGCP